MAAKVARAMIHWANRAVWLVLPPGAKPGRQTRAPPKNCSQPYQRELSVLTVCAGGLRRKTKPRSACFDVA